MIRAWAGIGGPVVGTTLAIVPPPRYARRITLHRLECRSNTETMTEQDNKPESTSPEDVARPVVKSRRQARVSWIWLVPLIAAIVGASLLFRDWLHAGPTVTISFE